jgi:hypothetical protein
MDLLIATAIQYRLIIGMRAGRKFIGYSEK